MREIEIETTADKAVAMEANVAIRAGQKVVSIDPIGPRGHTATANTRALALVLS